MSSEPVIIRSHHPFRLESGYELPELTIAYHSYGKLNAARDNVVWVCHALTANSDVADWWPHTVEAGAFLDPDKWYVVCANILGSHYGTTGPLHINPETGKPFYGDFPRFTIGDMVAAHRVLADMLGIGHIHALVGSSVGGFQALEWAAQEPGRFGKLILIATDAKASPWTIAIDETQRMAIKSDATYGEPRPDAGLAGLAAARAIGLLTYRGPEGYNITQQDACSDPFHHPESMYIPAVPGRETGSALQRLLLCGNPRRIRHPRHRTPTRRHRRCTRLDTMPDCRRGHIDRHHLHSRRDALPRFENTGSGVS